MADSVIISECNIFGRKQALIERVKGESPYYRVTIVNRFNSLDAAKSCYLEEVPNLRKEYYSKEVEDYAKSYRAKPPKGKAPAVETNKPAPAKRKGRRPNAKSKSKAT